MTDTLQSLLERLQNADGPDREIDALIRCALFAPPSAYVEMSPYNGEWCVYDGTDSKSGRKRLWEPRNIPHEIAAHEVRFTASIDSVAALVERMLPGYEWHLHYGAVFLSSGGYYEHEKEHHETIPLALLTAMTKALIAEQE